MNSKDLWETSEILLNYMYVVYCSLESAFLYIFSCSPPNNQ